MATPPPGFDTMMMHRLIERSKDMGWFKDLNFASGGVFRNAPTVPKTEFSIQGHKPEYVIHDEIQITQDQLKEIDFIQAEKRIMAAYGSRMDMNSRSSKRYVTTQTNRETREGVAIGGPQHGRTIKANETPFRISRLDDQTLFTTYHFHRLGSGTAFWSMKPLITEAIKDLIRYAAKKNRRKKK